MHNKFLRNMLLVVISTSSAWAQEPNSCAKLTNFKADNVEITKAAVIAAGTTEAIPWNQTRTAPLPAYCRVEGVMNRRTGVDGEEFGITFALAMPDHWNGDLLMQGGGGSNGIVVAPLGMNAAGDTPGLIRGFAVVSTDTGHKSRHPGFDFDFVRDQQAYLDFAYLANAEVASLAKQLIAQHYGKPAAFSYFSGCSTGGREGVILSQRYPTVFNGIISGDPAMRTGFSNLAIGRWIPIAFNQVAPKDANGNQSSSQSITDNDRKLIRDALIKKCDAKDGIADGSIADRSGATSTLRCWRVKAKRITPAWLRKKRPPLKRPWKVRIRRAEPKPMLDSFTTWVLQTGRLSEVCFHPAPAFSGLRRRT